MSLDILIRQDEHRAIGGWGSHSCLRAADLERTTGPSDVLQPERDLGQTERRGVPDGRQWKRGFLLRHRVRISRAGGGQRHRRHGIVLTPRLIDDGGCGGRAASRDRASGGRSQPGARQDADRLREPVPVAFQIIDVAGRIVSTLPARPWAAGRWTAGWSEAAGTRTRLRAGMYFVRMMAAGRLVGQKKFILIE